MCVGRSVFRSIPLHTSRLCFFLSTYTHTHTHTHTHTQEFDTDGSGELDYVELNAALKKNDIYLKRKHFNALVRFVDADLNGSVNVEE